MPVFSQPQNFIINGGQFTDIANNNSGPSGIDILLKASYPEAAHDAASREYAPRCFPGTRKQYIPDIIHWAVPALGRSSPPLYWMKGPAGVGKSAIAQTCAEKLKKLQRLGAAFFFSISGRKKPEKFFPSIAYQLSTIHPPYRDLIDDIILHDKTLVNKTLSSQFRYLIDKPLRKLETQGKGIGRRIAVIIDGLDECEGADAQCEIIRIIASAASKGALPLCWAFFSRPEPHIEATFAGSTVAPHCYKVILPISRDADGEIELYLRNGFENILKRHNTTTQPQWPSSEDMEILVDAASGSFIYATTVIRFVGHLGSPAPHKRLRAIIDIILGRRKRDPRAGTNADAPFAELDAFYILILQRIPTDLLPSVHLLLALICQWGTLGAILAANILGMPKDEFEAVCNHTSAVVHFQDPGKDLGLDPTIDVSCTYTQLNRDALRKLDNSILNDLGGRVSFYHKSFEDFLLDPARSDTYSTKASDALANHYLKMHLDFDQTYCWEDSRLVLAPGVVDSASSLSWPYTTELVNSLIKARAYIEFGGDDPQSFFARDGFARLSANRDFRKRLHIYTCLSRNIHLVPCFTSVWGNECLVKGYPGTCIIRISLAKFNVDEFKLMVKQRKQENVIQRYYPKWYSRIKSLFRAKPQERFESALYRVGHGDKSIFWYWEIDYELGYYRSLEATDLAEGERRFLEEDFGMWPASL